MENKPICGVWGHVTPYPEGYGQRLWAEVLMPELRKKVEEELLSEKKKRRKRKKKGKG